MVLTKILLINHFPLILVRSSKLDLIIILMMMMMIIITTAYMCSTSWGVVEVIIIIKFQLIFDDDFFS